MKPKFEKTKSIWTPENIGKKKKKKKKEEEEEEEKNRQTKDNNNNRKEEGSTKIQSGKGKRDEKE